MLDSILHSLRRAAVQPVAAASYVHKLHSHCGNDCRCFCNIQTSTAYTPEHLVAMTRVDGLASCLACRLVNNVCNAVLLRTGCDSNPQRSGEGVLHLIPNSSAAVATSESDHGYVYCPLQQSQQSLCFCMQALRDIIQHVMRGCASNLGCSDCGECQLWLSSAPPAPVVQHALHCCTQACKGQVRVCCSTWQQ